MAAGRRGRGDGDDAVTAWSWAQRWGATVSALHGSSDGRRGDQIRPQIWSPRLAGVTGDGLGCRRHRSADPAGGWLAAAMVADVAATKLATTAARAATPALVKNLAATREARRPR
ncbi:hypothetical protein OsI_02363 [Oryza sativa Indica Group]|uniref:Uncharacterized protein n=1 Tax=Oryza sativa subsp. indica TaxID=39946 RepID=B8AA03_ORYSI|nr:hypothetical protein OsI_02363 [Oryza sativa Indica Group]